MKLRPVGNRIIVRRDTAQSKTEGGILLPDTAKERPARGTVIAVGPGKIDPKGDGTMRIALSVKEGDTVLFAKWAGMNHDHPAADEMIFLQEDDILAVVEHEKGV